MSGLQYLCVYGNDSDSDDCDINCHKDIVKPKLPVPDLSNVATISEEKHIDCPAHHQGRLRRFPHVRGNWATFVYISYPDENALLVLANELKTLLTFEESCHICDEFHLSLSKTVVLNYHTITTFTQSLKEVLIDFERFYLGFDNIEVFCNEDKSRTFVVLKADFFSQKALLSILDKVNNILDDFKLEKFYDDPSFHISLLWTNGDQRMKLRVKLDSLCDIVYKKIENTLEEPVLIEKVNCKSGNKYFQFGLV